MGNVILRSPRVLIKTQRVKFMKMHFLDFLYTATSAFINYFITHRYPPLLELLGKATVYYVLIYTQVLLNIGSTFFKN